MNLLKISHLSKKYAHEDVLHDINLTIAAGEIAVLLGKSGSGKSTLLKCINQLEIPNTGSISILNDHYEFNSTYKINNRQLKLLRENVGMVFQQFHLWSHLNVLHNLTLAPIKVLKKDKVATVKKAMQLLTRFELAHKAKSMPHRLSGGQQQRVSIARSLMMDPKILLLDEPTSALDPQMTGEILAIIKQLKEDSITMLISTHEISFAKQIADSIYFLEHGKLLERGTIACLEKAKTEALNRFLQTA